MLTTPLPFQSSEQMVADFKTRPLDPGGYAYLSCGPDPWKEDTMGW